jgi:6-phospho-beta-glucosidase
VKLCVLGGGGFRVPLVYRALLRDTGSPRVDHVVLFDPDPARAETIRAVLAQLADGSTGAPAVEVATTLDAALTGSDFVFSAIRVGGLTARIADERVALEHGVLGQETTGPGGLAYALRTVPVALRIAEQVLACAPRAYVLNFTNPAGIITEAMRAVLGDRVIGICDTPAGMGHRLATLLGVPPSRVWLDYAGLNHLGWLRRIMHEGTDLLPGLLADDTLLAGTEEGAIFGMPWLRALGCVPNEYLYYYRTREAVRGAPTGATRGEYLLGQQDSFYRAAAADPGNALSLWEGAVAERSSTYLADARGDQQQPGAGLGYEGVALAVMAAIARDEHTTMILNVANGSTLAGLPADAVIEVPCAVDANGAHPLAVTPLDLHQSGLVHQVKAVERLTIEAAVSGSRDTALTALALHPLVDSVSVARDLLAGYSDRIPGVADVLRNP